MISSSFAVPPRKLTVAASCFLRTRGLGSDRLVSNLYVTPSSTLKRRKDGKESGLIDRVKACGESIIKVVRCLYIVNQIRIFFLSVFVYDHGWLACRRALWKAMLKFRLSGMTQLDWKQ